MKISDDTEKQELFDRLLWLRNHYDLGDPSLKREVLRRVDETLDKFLPDGFKMTVPNPRMLTPAPRGPRIGNADKSEPPSTRHMRSSALA